MEVNYHIFKTDKKTIDTQKVTFSIWKNRSNAAYVSEFTETLSKFVEEKRVFNEIEYYLPQLAHLIIHLDVDWTAQSLERLCVVLSQTSIHTALQLCFMLIAAMEDYQPENADGKSNPNCNLECYFRCVRLLHNVERAVVFGSPTLTSSESKQLGRIVTGELRDSEKNDRADEIMKMNTKASTAVIGATGAGSNPSITTDKAANNSLHGQLLYKREVKKSLLGSKSWKPRYFRVELHILQCFKDEGSKVPMRAIAIQDFELFTVKREKYLYQFELKSRSSGVKYQLRATDQATYDYWVDGLKREASRHPSFPTNSKMISQTSTSSSPGYSPPHASPSASPRPPAHNYGGRLDGNGHPIENGGHSNGNSHGSSNGNSPPNGDDDDGDSDNEEGDVSPIAKDELAKGEKLMECSHMTAGQRKRFQYFQQQRAFISKLTEISEKLRFLDRTVRPHFLKHDMGELVVPPFCYLPLCRSVDTWKYVLRPLPLECHAFNTKARCPALMLFEVEEHHSSNVIGDSSVDVATFLGLELHEYAEEVISIPVKLPSLLTPAPPAVAPAHIGHAHDNTETPVRINESYLPPPPPVSTVQSLLSKKSPPPPFVPLQQSLWKPEGTGILKIKESLIKSAAIPPQSVLNNSALREHQRFSNDDFKSTTSPPRAGANGDVPLLQQISFQDKSSHPKLVQEPAKDSEKENKTVNFMTGAETFADKAARLRKQSPFGHLSGWKIDGLIAKSNDDLRQEAFVMQLIVYYQIAFQVAKLPVWLFTYRILSTSKSTGLIQLIPDAISLDGLKKSKTFPGTLRGHFEKAYGLNPDGTESPLLKAAISEYVKSLAGYSIVCYVLAIKDRHNGNIMIDSAGRLIHIDFGFVFGLAPGKQFSMETAPWKLTEEMVEVMGGLKSFYFKDYANLCTQAFIEVRKHSEAVVTMIEIMSHKSSFPAFRFNPNAVKDFRKRLLFKIPDKDLAPAIMKLIKKSYHNKGTGLYDSFQTATNGIAK